MLSFDDGYTPAFAPHTLCPPPLRLALEPGWHFQSGPWMPWARLTPLSARYVRLTLHPGERIVRVEQAE